MDRLRDVEVELSVVLGRAELTLGELLRLPRGGLIRLDSRAADDLWIFAGESPLARGRVRLDNGRVRIELTSLSAAPEQSEP